MKAELKFDLDDLDDRQAHLRCIKSLDMACVLFEFSANSRKRIEHKFFNSIKDDGIHRDNDNVFDEIMTIVFEEFNGLMEGNDVNIDKLII
jgi:hypothetical protein